MKNIFFKIIILLLINFNFCKAQNKVLKVTYKIKLENANTKVKHPDTKKAFNSFKTMEYQLVCNKNSSVYSLIEKLEINDDFTYKIATVLAGDGIYYTNKKDKVKLKQSSTSGETFNIISNYNKYKWNITKETKTINGYLCYKATCSYKEYSNRKKTEVTFYLEVWFTPDIPYSFGPKGLDGLPGLVLEGRVSGRITLYATKIELNYLLKKDELSKPKGGIDISKEDYSNLLSKKMKRIHQR